MLVSVLGRAAIDGLVVGSLRQRRVLSALVLHEGSFVSTGHLALAVWGAEQPVDPAAALHTLVSRLRSVLGEYVSISSSNGEYRLVASPGVLDIDLVGSWHSITNPLDGAARVAALDDLLGLFRGEPFADLDDLDVIPRRSHFEELRLSMLETRAEALASVGRPGDAVVSLREVIGAQPHRESAVLALMRVLYATGQQVAALDAAVALREHLLEHFGIDPSPIITDFELAVLRHEVGKAPDESAVTSPRSASLPSPITSFVGREAEVGELYELVDRHRLTTLLGPGGIGKTRVALEVAARWRASGRALHFIELANLEPSDLLVDSIAGNIGVVQTNKLSLDEALFQRLDAERTVVVLDNCEHIRPAAAEFVARLLVATRGVTVLTTSREPLRVQGEHRWVLSTLPAADAATLFIDRARAARRTFDADPTDQRVVQLCRQLDELPLALELAASALSGRSLERLLDELVDRFDALATDDPALPERHRSLGATLDWSYSRLDRADQHAFDRLGVFAGAFTADDVLQLIGEQSERRLAQLVDASMVVYHEVEGVGIYEMLDTMRAFARVQRGEALDGDRARHAAWMLERSCRMREDLMGPAELSAFGWFRHNLANLRQAHHWFVVNGDDDNRIRLIDSLILWAWQHRQSEVLGWAGRLRDDAETVDPDLAAIGAGCATLALSRTRFASLELVDGCLRSVEGASHHAVALAHYAAADIGMFLGRYDLAAQYAAVAFDHAQQGTDAVDTVQLSFFAVSGRAFADFYLGRVEAAERSCVEAEHRAVRHDSLVAHAWIALARGEGYAVSQPDRARLHADRCLSLADPREHVALFQMASFLRAFIGTQLGEPAALERLSKQLEHLDRIAAWHDLVIVLCVAVDTLATLGHHREAVLVVGSVTEASDDRLAIAQRTRLAEDKARGGLTTAAFEAAWTEGAALSLGESVQLTVATLRGRSATPPR